MIHKCPENLEILLVNLPEEVFKSLSEEPDTKTLRRCLEMLGKDSSEERIQEEFRHMVKNYVLDQRTAAQLFKYGNTREEIVERIRQEVKSCLTCSAGYLDFLKKHAMVMIQFAESKREPLRTIGELYKQKGLFGNIVDLDRQYLGLLKKI